MAHLRSQDWFGKTDKMGFYYRSWFKNQGYPNQQYPGHPVIVLGNTWSKLSL
jgi:dihydroxy-acid dehydratase